MSKLNMDFVANKLNLKKAEKLYGEISNISRNSGYLQAKQRVNSPLESDFCIALDAYLLNKVSQFNDPFSITFDKLFTLTDIFDADVLETAKRILCEESWNQLLKLTEYNEPELFALTAVIEIDFNTYSPLITTPSSLISLSERILDIQPKDKVADFCCGAGNFIVKTGLKVNADYSGYEVSFNSALIAKIRSDLIGANVHINIGDLFDISSDETFDKIFSNYPFGLNVRNRFIKSEYIEHMFDSVNRMSKTTSSDWYFNNLICEHLNENGKAVAIMTNGSTWNTSDLEIRKHFIENNLIEAVICLPPRMFIGLGIQTSLIVFSKTEKSSIRMIDASKICQYGRRNNSFNEQDLNKIIEALEKDSEYSQLISKEELRENEYTLYLPRYIKDNFSFDNGVEFSSIIKNILRGAPCKAAELDLMSSPTETNMQYLMLANIKDGIIQDDLPYLSRIDPKYEKYCLKNNDLILSKNGFPYKIAIANIKDGQKILANGNLYMIEIDEKKANPLYVKAFLESEAGIATLKSITVGAAIPNIGIDSLKKIKIPLPTLEEQNKIVEKYNMTLDEISILKMRLDKAYNKLRHILDEE